MGCFQSKPSNKTATPNGGPVQNEVLRPPRRDSNYDEVKRFRALYSYSARESDDLTFQTGEILVILDDSEPNWWLAKRGSTGEKGWVPSNYIAEEHTLDVMDWYFGDISRVEAEELLLRPSNKRGTFLVRLSLTRGYYVISLLDRDLPPLFVDDSYSHSVKHYRIRSLEGQFYITPRRCFPSIKELVSHYQGSSDGLSCQLTTSCQRYAKPSIDLSRTARDKWEIPRGSLQLKERLGSGQFGDVYLAIWQRNVKVAVKSMRPNLLDSSHKENFLKEAELMKQLHHKQLVRLYAVCTEEEPFFIVTEYMGNGSLLVFLRNNSFPLIKLINFGIQIASGMAYLARNKYIHRDLAARNVLVADDHMVKVADFGMARFVPNEVYHSHSREFPFKWTAPEALQHDEFTHKSDVWSFGVLLYEIFTHGANPYVGINNNQILEKIQMGTRLPQPRLKLSGSLLPDPIYNNCMLDCWHIQPDRRPTFDHLQSFLDSYLKNILGDSDNVVDATAAQNTGNGLPRSTSCELLNYSEMAGS